MAEEGRDGKPEVGREGRMREVTHLPEFKGRERGRKRNGKGEVREISVKRAVGKREE